MSFLFIVGAIALSFGLARNTNELIFIFIGIILMWTNL